MKKILLKINYFLFFTLFIFFLPAYATLYDDAKGSIISNVYDEDKGECKKPYLASNTTHTLDISTIKYKINGAWQTDPTADAEGYNALVTDIKIETIGMFPGYCGTERSFEIKFRVGVK